MKEKKKYTFIRVYETTKKMLDDRTDKVNKDLKILGIRDRKIPKIKFYDVIAKKLSYISDKDLIKMSVKRNRKC